MVLNKDGKEDVFAHYHLDQGVADNEDSLNQQVEAERNSMLAPSEGNAFTEFKLEEIVRKHEERLYKEENERKAAEELEESGSIRASSERVSSSLRGLGLFRRPPPFLSQRMASKDSDEAHSLRHYSSRREKEETESNTVLGDGGRSVAPTITDRKGYNKNRRSPQKKNKHENSSRSGTTITTALREEDEEDYASAEDEMISIGDGDVEEGENADYNDDVDDDDEDSFIGVRNGKKRKASDIITRSSTGMPLGGMLASNTREAASSTQPEDYRWVSPHSADTIFRDFDIDAIVKDYERIHRDTTYGVPGKNGNILDDIDEENNNNEHVLGIKVRYRTILMFWLENFPRTHGILFRILIPLFLIIGITYLLGWYLAILEKGDEIANNNAIIRAQYNLTGFPEEDLYFLSSSPGICFDHYLEQKRPGNEPFKNSTILSELDFPPISPGTDTDPEALINEIQAYMTVCNNAVNATLDKHTNYKESEIDAASQAAMTFHWIRCWNTTTYGNVNPFFPNKKQLKAAVNQPEFFYDTWKLNQTALYKQYLLEENITDQEAFDRSIEYASGEAMCGINRPTSAWFWFVFMTTVGYGNVSPITTSGRLFVGAIGWFTVIGWAILLYIAGKVLGIIIDDLFRRCNLRRLTGNLPSVIVWGSVSLAWLIFIGEFYVFWYNRTEHPDKFRFTPFGLNRGGAGYEDEMGISDAYWFSYISLLTVGK